MAAREHAEAVAADRSFTEEITAELISISPRFILLTRDDSKVAGEMVAVNIDQIIAIFPTPYGAMVYTNHHQYPVRDDFDELVRTLNGETDER